MEGVGCSSGSLAAEVRRSLPPPVTAMKQTGTYTGMRACTRLSFTLIVHVDNDMLFFTRHCDEADRHLHRHARMHALISPKLYLKQFSMTSSSSLREDGDENILHTLVQSLLCPSPPTCGLREGKPARRGAGLALASSPLLPPQPLSSSDAYNPLCKNIYRLPTHLWVR